MEKRTTPEGLSWWRDLDRFAGLDYSMAGFGQLASGYLAYGNQKTQAGQYGVQAASLETSAEAVELAAAEATNQLRQKYLDSVGNLQYSAAARGVAVDSGSVRQNMERSGQNLGEDIAKTNRSASMQAKTLRANAAVARGYEKAYGKTAELTRWGGMLSSLGNLGLGFNLLGGGGPVKNPKETIPQPKK